MKPSPEVEGALSRVRIFSSLPRRDLRKLSAMCHLKTYAAGKSIIKEGSTGLGMFLLTSGRVEVFKSLEGRRIRLAVLEQGAVLGEMALLDDQPRSASAVALDPSECLLLSRDAFGTLVKWRPRIAWRIVPALVRRVRDLQEQLLDAEGRSLPAATSAPSRQRREEPTSTTEAPRSPQAERPSNPSRESAESAESSAPADSHHDDNADCNDSAPGLLRTQYAMMMAGAAGLGESARLMRSLDEETGLSRGRPLGDVARDMPAGLFTAGMSSWDEGMKVPSKMLERFQDHLRSTGAKKTE